MLLIGLFLLSVVAAGLSFSRWVKRFDQPPAGTYRLPAGDERTLFFKLSQKSIKGLHRTNNIRAHLGIPGEAAPRALTVRDTTSGEWEKKIKIAQFIGASQAASVENNVVLLLETRIPDEPALYGQTIPLTFDLDMILPRVDEGNPKAGREEPARANWTCQLQIMPPGYARIYQRVGRISLITAGTALALIFLRELLRKKPSASAPPA